jgi:hypothetical protein
MEGVAVMEPVAVELKSDEDHDVVTLVVGIAPVADTQLAMRDELLYRCEN